jgi:hypothetical protein
MADDSTRASLEEKYQTFIQSLDDDELALFRRGLEHHQDDEDEVQGFMFNLMPMPKVQTSGAIKEITQDVTVNKAKTADKAFNAMDGYIRG